MGGIHHDQILDPMSLKDVESLGGQAAEKDRDGARGHDRQQRSLPDRRIFLESTDKITMGVDADDFALGINDHGGTAPFGGNLRERLGNGGLLGADRNRFAGAHDLLHGKKEIPADRAGGMKLGKIFAAKPTTLQENHGQGIPHGQHGGGAGGGGKVEGAGFLIDRDVEKEVRLTRQLRTRIACHDHDGHALPFDQRDDPEQLIRIPTVTQNEDQVLTRHDPQIAMDGIDWVQGDGSRTSAGQGGGNLMADVALFSDTGDDDLSAFFQPLLH